MEKSIFEIMRKEQLDTTNGNIVYWVNDCEDTEIALVFLHGLTADHTLFEKQVAYYHKKYKVLCWDAPAHGKSRPYADFSYSRTADHLKDILEKEQIKKAILVGQSMGGFIAQAFLKKYATMAAGFVGIDTCPFGLAYYSKSDVWWLRQVEWMSMCFPRNLLVTSIAKSCTYTDESYQNMLTALSPYSKKELCRLMGIGYTDFLKENYDLEIHCPILILVGEYDKTGKTKQYCEAWSKKTSFPLHIIPNAAHNSNYDNSETVNTKIDLFLHSVLKKG